MMAGALLEVTRLSKRFGGVTARTLFGSFRLGGRTIPSRSSEARRSSSATSWLPSGTWLLNPGSPTNKRSQPRYTWLRPALAKLPD